MPASGWGSLWESSSFVHWFLPSGFRDVSRANPEWPWISELKLNSSIWEGAPKVRLLGPLFCYSTLTFLRNLNDITFLWSRSCCVLCQVAPRMLFIILLVQGCNFLPISQSCQFLQEEIEQPLRLKQLFPNEFNPLLVIIILVRKKNEIRLIINVSDIHNHCDSYIHISFFYLFLGRKHKFLHAKSKYRTNREK